MILERFCGEFRWLSSVVLRTDLVPGEAVIRIESASAAVTLRLVGIVHIRAELFDPEFALVDEVVVRELPRWGPWPAEARHLLDHHNNRCALHWLTVVGPNEVEVLAEDLSIDWTSNVLADKEVDRIGSLDASWREGRAEGPER
ncbi:hypothetical protein ACFV4P_15715 [Kitasatospora sp. NPDC059795]|uniref:hypothetical protein n=1 Tax=Kitasatospora sp. NPDC059795 TaxID=3346949 RepID=UPI00365C31F8